MRHVPIEFWPEETRQAMAVAFAARAEATADRVREQMLLRLRCSCATTAELAEARCSRCWGWPDG